MVRECNDYGEACLRLMEFGLEDELALKYFDSYIAKVDDKDLLKYLLRKPLTIPQYMTALDSAVEQRDRNWIEELINDEKFKNESNPYLNELREQANKMM